MPEVDLFAKSQPAVKATYAAILQAVERFGEVRVEAKKTSIHLCAKSAFAGVHPQSAALMLTVRAAVEIKSPRVRKAEQTSASRWHMDLKVTSPEDVDHELIGWLRAAYDLSRG
jgi:hypothetical protein